MKAVGILIAAFLTSLILASFFYIQPGSAQASAESVECVTHGTVEDLDSANAHVKVTVDASAGCPKNVLYVYALDESGNGNAIARGMPEIESDGSYTVTVDFRITNLTYGYLIKIEDAFSASIAP